MTISRVIPKYPFYHTVQVSAKLVDLQFAVS